MLTQAVLAAVMPVVRSLVASVGPETAMAARRLLWALAPVAVWAHETAGSVGSNSINPRRQSLGCDGVGVGRGQGGASQLPSKFAMTLGVGFP